MLVSEEKRGDKLSDNSSNNFPFIKLPRALIDDPNFSGLSAEAKLLFSLILDRMGVSQINADRFTDKNGNLFVYYTIQEICIKLGCSHGKAVRLVNELEYHGLIFKQRKGCGKPNKIIVLPSVLRILKTVHKKSNNENSEVPENGNQKFSISEVIYNNNSYNNISYLHPSIEYERLIESIEEQIEYDCINADAEIVREIILIMADVISGTSSTVRIGGSDFPREVVISRFRKLTAEHIEYIVGCIESSETKIKNIKAYLISALFNAPTTIANSVSAEFAYYQNLS